MEKYTYRRSKKIFPFATSPHLPRGKSNQTEDASHFSTNVQPLLYSTLRLPGRDKVFTPPCPNGIGQVKISHHVEGCTST